MINEKLIDNNKRGRMTNSPLYLKFEILKSFIVFLWSYTGVTLHNTVLGAADEL